MQKELFRDVKFQEKTYRINKMDARTGSWLATQVFSKVLPMGMDNQLGGSIPNLPSKSIPLTKQEFFELQNECLMVCSELREVGSTLIPMPILTGTGEFVDKELEYNLAAVMMLTIQAIVFNASGFFDGNTLKEFSKTMSKDLKAFGVKI